MLIGVESPANMSKKPTSCCVDGGRQDRKEVLANAVGAVQVRGVPDLFPCQFTSFRGGSQGQIICRDPISIDDSENRRPVSTIGFVRIRFESLARMVPCSA